MSSHLDGRKKATLTEGNAADIPTRCTPWLKTMSNAYKAAERDGLNRIVGSTYTSHFITKDLDSTEARQHGRYMIDPEGNVYKIDQSDDDDKEGRR